MPLSKARNRDRMRDVNSGEKSCLQPKGAPRYANLTGSTRKFLSVDERLELLSEIAQNGNTKLASPVEAVKEINRMTGAYPPIQHQVASKVVFEIVYVDRRELPQPVVERLTEAQPVMDAITPPDRVLSGGTGDAIE